MKIAICVKQVPDSKNTVLDPKTKTLVRQAAGSVMNPFDAHALAAAVALKKKYGANITAVSMGIPAASATLKEAIALGADEAILLSDRALAGSDTLATAYALSEGIKGLKPDLIICGLMAIDGDTAQVGPSIAQHLGIPHAGPVVEIKKVTESSVTVTRLIAGGSETVTLPLPALVVAAREIAKPDLATLGDMIRALRSNVKMENAESLKIDPEKVGLNGSPTKVIRTYTPERQSQCNFLKGTPDAAAAELLGLLKKKGAL